MIPGLVVWYQPICSLNHAEDVSYYVTCFSATTIVDERRISVLSDQATVIFDVEFDVQLVVPWQICISYLVQSSYTQDRSNTAHMKSGQSSNIYLSDCLSLTTI